MDPSDFLQTDITSIAGKHELFWVRSNSTKKTEQGTALWHDANAGIIWIIDGPRRRLEQLVNRVHGEAAVTVGHGRAGAVYVQMEVEVKAASSTLRTQLIS
jgi:hypothetical protein